MRYEMIAGPECEPVTLAEAKDHLRLSSDAEDAYIASLITAARHAVEAHLELFLITRQIDLYMDSWPVGKNLLWWDGVMDGAWVNLRNSGGYVALPVKPVSLITQVVTIDGAGVETVMDPALYYLQPGDRPRLYKSNVSSWPAVVRAADGIRLRLNVGFGDSWNTVPELIRQALLHLVAYLYANRGDEPGAAITLSGVRNFLGPYRETRV